MRWLQNENSEWTDKKWDKQAAHCCTITCVCKALMHAAAEATEEEGMWWFFFLCPKIDSFWIMHAKLWPPYSRKSPLLTTLKFGFCNERIAFWRTEEAYFLCARVNEKKRRSSIMRMRTHVCALWLRVIWIDCPFHLTWMFFVVILNFLKSLTVGIKDWS